MTERVFVLGSNSFSGASFVAYTLSRGVEVLGASRSPEPHRAFLPYAWSNDPSQSKRFQFKQLDLNRHTDELAGAIEQFRPAYVVNFAAQSMVAESWLYPEHWYQTNVVANVRLHDKIRRFDFIRKYVHISTPEVYGSCSGLVTESAPFNPTTPYAASRAACDLHLITFLKQYKFPVVFTRAANVYGPGQQLYRIIPRAILFARLGRKLQLHGGGRSVRSFIHIRDVSDGTFRVMQQAPAGESYHLSTGLNISVREVVERIYKKMGIEFSQGVEIVGDRPGKDAAYLLDSAKARQTLGWKDGIDLDAGLAETIDWVTKNFDDLAKQPSDYIHKP
jgi:dTDP-glucose 4,6-dehydratase